MANTIIRIRNSGVTSNTPSTLLFGELAINYADGKLFFKRANNYIQSFDLNATETSNATSNIALMQAVDDWQNTRITAIDSFAGGAYDKANSASSNTIYTQGVDETQNTRITAVDNYASGAYAQSNTNSNEITALQGVNTTQNTRITAVDTYATSAYGQANTNASDITIIQGVNTTQNTNISAIDSFAGGAYNKANSANVLAQAAFNTANTKYASSGGEISGDVTITGNLVVQGTQFTTSTQTLAIADNMIYLNNAISANISNAVGNGTYVVYTTTINHNYIVGNYVMITGITPSSLNISGASNTLITAVTANTFTVASSVTDEYVSDGVARARTAANPDLGFAAGYNDGTYHHTGLFRDATDGTWKFFYNYTPEPDESVYIDTNHASFLIANLTANIITDVAVIRGFDPIDRANAAFDQANASNNLAQSSYNQANTNAGNITVIQGVDNTQNTNITHADTKAQAAFDKANTSSSYSDGVDAWQNTRITAVDTYATSAYGQANTNATNIGIIQGVDTWQNTRITAVDSYASSSYAQANAANNLAQSAFNSSNTASSNTVIIQGVDVWQNTRITAVDSYAGGAYAQANAANNLAQSAFNKANNAIDQYSRDTANSASSNTVYNQGVDTTQNTRITAVDSFAGGAYNQANAANNLAQSAFNKANTAASDITVLQGVDTTQNTRIQAAFDKANNASPMLKVASINSSNVYSNIVSNVSTIAFDSFTGFHVDDMGEGNVKISLGSTFSTWNVVGQGNLNAVGDDIIRINGANGIVITTNPSDTPYKSITFNGKTIYDHANAANNLAQSAYDKANSAYAVASDALGVWTPTAATAQAAFDKANTATNNITIIQGVDTWQNTRITAVDTYAGSAYAQANAANNLAQSAYDKANTGGEYAIDNVARITANSASSNTVIIQGVDTWQNTRITAVDAFAQAAYNQANTGGGGGVVSLGGFAANNVLTVNSAGYIANNANLNYYTSNNTLVVTGNVIGGGIRSTSSSTAPTNPVIGDVWYKTTTDVLYRYTSDGTSAYWLDITGSSVRLDTGIISAGGIKVTDTFIATANQTTFTTSQGYDVNALDVYYNGVKLIKDSDYTASDGLTVVLTSPATAYATIQLVAWSSPINILSPFLLMGA